MIAVDTNVIIRLLTRDHAVQHAAARSLFNANPVWISKTVLLETEWVLRSLYEFDESEVRSALKRLLGLANVHAEDLPSFNAALALNERGLDFADAIHLSCRPVDAEFATFDRSLVNRAVRAGVKRVFLIPEKTEKPSVRKRQS